MSERIEQYKANLASTRQYLEQVLDSVGDRWEVQVYSDGPAWTVRQLAIHVADAGRGQKTLVMNIASGQEGVPADFDLDRYNKRSIEKRAEMSNEEVRRSLDAERAELIAWLDTIDDSVLEKRGRHGTLRILSIGELLDVIADHERQHAEDIARVLGQMDKQEET